MLPQPTVSLSISVARLVVVGILSIPASIQYVKRIQRRKSQYSEVSDVYADKDGTATEESQEAFSDFVPRLILILTSAVAAVDALAAAVIATIRPQLPLAVDPWLQFASWVSS